jgi:S-adenosylmethionine:diacylglycerol 3-amino-3-carboxypropyl transferase
MGFGKFSGMELSSTVPKTAWESNRLSARGGFQKLLFGTMHEDSTIELAAFPSRGRIFCIASAGCTAMQLAHHHEVVAVDLNPVQIAYVKRRLTGSPIERGAAERITGFGRAFAPLVGWNKSRLRSFLELDDPKEQITYWRRYLDTRRFRAAFDIVFSRSLLRAIYSNALLDCLPPNFGTVLRRRMERCFSLHSNRQNPYARELFLGEIRSVPVPERIELECADASAFLESQPVASFDGFTLSNILDGANPAYERRLFAAVKHAAAPGALVVLRSVREPASSAKRNYASQDRSILWGTVEICPAEAL